jgi:hypothetical protein
VTISAAAKHAASGGTLSLTLKKGGAGASHAGGAATTSSSQTSASSYVAKVRALMASDPNLTSSQAITAVGVPQAEQTQVAAALG